MHMPANRGGVNPTAYLVAPNGGEVVAPGSTVEVQWISDDDLGVTSAALEYSTDGGGSWNPVASGLAAAGSYNWQVPSVRSNDALLRVIVADASANNGQDDSEWSFSIAQSNEAAFTNYGIGKAGSLGIPVLNLNSNPVLGASITLQISQALPNSTAKLLRGNATAATPFDGALALVDFTAITDVAIDNSGDGTLHATVPTSPVLIGRSFYWQAWIPNDPAAGGLGWACSNGLRTQLGL